MIYPPRNLGRGDYWGRVVERRLDGVSKTQKIAGQDLGGLGRATDASIMGLSRTAERLTEAIDQLNVVAKSIPVKSQQTNNAFNFSVGADWTNVVSASIPTPAGKTSAGIVVTSQASLWQIGTGGGGNPFQWPFPLAYVSGEYGYQDDPTNPGTTRFHGGMDFAGGPASGGSPIYAPANGTVRTKGFQAERGNYIELDHSTPYGPAITRYFHLLSGSPLAIGASVTRGSTVLGLVGSTGLSTGNHLHYETWIVGGELDPRGMQTMNPRDFMNLMEGSGPSTFNVPLARLVVDGVVVFVFRASGDQVTADTMVNQFFPVAALNKAPGATVSAQLQITGQGANFGADSRNQATMTLRSVFT